MPNALQLGADWSGDAVLRTPAAPITAPQTHSLSPLASPLYSCNEQVAAFMLQLQLARPEGESITPEHCDIETYGIRNSL